MIEKCCNKCYIIKQISEFSKAKSNKDGYSNTCKPCKAIISKKWIENNKDRSAYSRKAYSDTHKEENRARAKAWRENNRDRVIAKSPDMP